MKPHECEVLFTLPRTLDAFREHARPEGGRDFPASVAVDAAGLGETAATVLADPVRVADLWNLRVRPVVEGCLRILDGLGRGRRSAPGVRVVLDARAQDLAAACARSRVVTLVAHWSGDRVDMFDRCYAAPDLAAYVPTDYGGVIDLSVCNSYFLYDAIRPRNRHCVLGPNKKRTRFVFRVALYKHVIAHLYAYDRSFAQAVAAVRGMSLDALADEAAGGK